MENKKLTVKIKLNGNTTGAHEIRYTQEHSAQEGKKESSPPKRKVETKNTKEESSKKIKNQNYESSESESSEVDDSKEASEDEELKESAVEEEEEDGEEDGIGEYGVEVEEGEEGEEIEEEDEEVSRDAQESTEEHKQQSRLTSRQKALLKGDGEANEKELLSLPMGPKKSKTSEEDLLRRSEKAQRRREQAERQNEQEQKMVIDQLLNRGKTRKKVEDNKEDAQIEDVKKMCKYKPVDGPKITYISNREGNFLHLPEIATINKHENPKRERCRGPNCHNPCKYWSSDSKVPLCSLECYKQMHAIH